MLQNTKLQYFNYYQKFRKKNSNVKFTVKLFFQKFNVERIFKN